jgi:hypothetical protein
MTMVELLSLLVGFVLGIGACWLFEKAVRFIRGNIQHEKDTSNNGGS